MSEGSARNADNSGAGAALAGAALAGARQSLENGDLGGALAAAEGVLREKPDDADALYLAAVCQRYLGRHPAALETLDRLLLLAPDHGRACQEQGHNFRALNRPEDALGAYARACHANPALVAAWQAQLEILRAARRDRAAHFVEQRLARLSRTPKPLLGVMDLISRGKLLRAETLCRQFLERVPHHPEAMRLLADVATRLGVLRDADLLLESAVELDPGNVDARIDYIQVLRKRQQFERALEQAQALHDSEPDNAQYRSLVAIELMQTGDFEGALEMFDAVLDVIPGDPATLTSKGHALKTCGRADEAVEAYRNAVRSESRHGEAYYALANLKTYRFDDSELVAMEREEAQPAASWMNRVYLGFALGKAWEDRGDYERAFRFYARGNALKRAQSRYDAGRMSADLVAQEVVCTRDLFDRAAAEGAGCDAPDPIFVLGLPRAGSTLLEQILASHSQVDGTLELPNILSLSHQLRRGERLSAERRYPDVLAELPGEELTEFGRRYIEETRIHRQGAPYFIDKMPNNFRHIGLIRLILPNAKVIDARRSPMACCFSGFKQLFAEGQEFSYDLGDIGSYYRDYVRLMDHWDTVVPDWVLRVRHEDVVADLDGQVRRILDFCGLPFEDACLRFHETERAVRTPSSEQVRQPIFADAVDQWRNFEPWLGPLKTALGDLADG